MRQSILLLILVMVVVLSAHFALLTRVNTQSERWLRDTPLRSDASDNDADGFDDAPLPIADAMH